MTDVLVDHPFIRKFQNRSEENNYVCCKCFFCEEMETGSDILHEAMTCKVTERVKKCALDLQDQRLIAKT